MIRKYYIDDDPGGGGGEDPKAPKPPLAPKSYAITTPQQRTEWNGFLDYLDKQGKGGTPELDQPGAGLKYFQQYKKANPNLTLTPEHIQNIQYEQYQLRKGEQFGSLDKMRLDHLRAGLAPGYLNRPVSDVNGQINSATSKLYYPAGKTYGTDIEHYDSAVGQPTAAAQSDPVPAAPTTTPGGVPPAVTANPASLKTPPGAIPLPDYNDPKSRAAYLGQFPAKYGSFVHGRGDSIVRINEVPEYGNVSAKEAAIKEAKKQGLDPALLYSSTMEEGASGLYPDKKGEINAGEGTSDKYPVSGFGNYGLDNFHGDFKAMVAKGYLPKDLDYEPSYHKNENGDKVPSANFKNTEDAMAAKAAYVHFYQDKLDSYLDKTDTKLSPTAKQFFTLIGFNGGPARAQWMIDYYKKNGLLEGDKFLTVKPPKSIDPKDSYGNVLPRLQMANLLRKEKLIE